MRIVMIGAGYVGLVSGACLSDFGHEVICVDTNAERVAMLRRGEVPIFEPGLADLMARNTAAGRLAFTGDLAGPAAAADAIFIAVGTPARRGDGHADLSHVETAARALAAHLQGHTLVVTKSTVPVGTNRLVGQILRQTAPDASFDIASNPEFLREGAAIEDFMRPDRVVCGIEGPEAGRARAMLEEIYRPLFLRETPMVFTDLESAEMIKYAANAFLATKITFINEIADLCERVGADVQQVAKGIGLDGRIGSKFLHPGPGYGGSCFPKDTAALARTAREQAMPLRLVETVIEVNEARKRAMAAKVLEAVDGRAAGKRIAVLGVTFKPNTDDMRDAPALVIVPALIGAGAEIRICDPEGRKEGAAMLPGAQWFDDAYEAAEQADALVIITEWNAFRALDLRRLRGAMRGTVMVDLRNVYRPAEARAAGFAYTSVGRS